MGLSFPKIVLASFNRDKVRELRALLARYHVDVLGLYEVAGSSAPAESGKTVAENALIKARAAFQLTGLPTIADDTGLEVDALGGLPGIFAARFAGAGASYRDNLLLLLERLENVPLARRTARFRTACAAVLRKGRELTAEGVLEGRITLEPRGSEGFGYDPVFEVGTTGRTLAEMSAPEKNRISHRALAMKNLVTLLELE